MNVLNFASTYGEGLTVILTNMVLGQNRYGIHSYMSVSGEKEQQRGLFQLLNEAGARHSILKGLDEHENSHQLYLGLKDAIVNFRPSIVHVHTNWQLALAAAVRIRVGPQFQIVYTVHGFRHNHQLKRLIAKPMIQCALKLMAQRVVTPCTELRKQFSWVRYKSKVVFQGLPDSYFDNIEAPHFHGTKRLMFAGQFRHGKNQDMLIKALRDYIDRSNDSDVVLYLPGNGEQLEGCRGLAESLGLSTNVVFPGFLPPSEILKLYQTCQFALIPSNDETYGQCIVEPFALGRVVFTRRIGVAGDIIVDGDSGVLFDKADDLTEKLLQYLPNRDLCHRISINGLRQGEQFRWATVIAQLEQLYSECTGIYSSENRAAASLMGRKD